MNTRIRIWISLMLILCLVTSGGCSLSGLLGPNLSINVVIPLGLGGAPGAFNPFGMMQAMINAILGDAVTSTDGATSTSTGTTSPPPDVSGITTVLN
jgi:hypothetical protein